MNDSRSYAQGLNAMNKSRLWWALMTSGHELRALDTMNNSGLWIT